MQLQSSSRSERVKNVLRPKIGDYFSGGLMEHGLSFRIGMYVLIPM